VANAIYTTTRDELAGLVSRQVAGGMLSRAIASVGSDPSTIDAYTMSRLLRGRVRRELERTLPRAGVRRRLADLDARLVREHGHAEPDAGRDRPRPYAASTASPARVPATDADVLRSDERPNGAPSAGQASRSTPSRAIRPPTIWTHEPADTGTPDERRRAFPVAGDDMTRPAARPAPSTATTPTPAHPPMSRPAPAPAAERAAPPPVTPSSLTPPMLAAAPVVAESVAAEPVADAAVAAPPPAARPRPDRLIERVTDDDSVRQWIWSPAHGPPEGRGAGPEPDAVVSVLSTLTTVLGQRGAVRSVHVHHGRGHVMMGVDRGSTLVIAGDEDLNLGAVYATFRALEEEP